MTNLKFHDISTSWSSNKSSANIGIILIHGSNIPWVFIMVNYLVNMQKENMSKVYEPELPTRYILTLGKCSSAFAQLGPFE